MDTAMTGFGPMAATNKGSGGAPFHHYAVNGANVTVMNDNKATVTPMNDKSSILASKPFIGGKLRH